METVPSIGASPTVLVFHTMGLIGRSSVLSVTGSLCNFAIP